VRARRARTPQLYVMGSDGTGQDVLARFDYGATGMTSAPEWSPDGRLIAFHRDVGGVPQLFVVDVDDRGIRQLTGSGRNEDPTWAPDSRHLAFVSSRTGARELWVLDLETGRLRQLTSVGGARLPSWSARRTTNEGRP
jgi:TolB protein